MKACNCTNKNWHLVCDSCGGNLPSCLDCTDTERQLKEARAEVKSLKDDKHTNLKEILQLRHDVTEARAEIERLALEIENKQYTTTCASEENQQLKESLAEARAEIEQLKSRNNASVSAHMWLIMRHAFTSGAYKGYSHGTEHKLLEQMFKEWCSKDYPETAEKEVERLTEIERKDKLVEQMREALESVRQKHYVNDEDNWYSCPASGLCSKDSAGTDCDCGADYVNHIIDAALSAAERMGK